MPVKAPPLTVWLYACGLFMGMLCLAYLYSESLHSLPDEIPERLANTEPSDRSFKVVLIGTSLTGWGFYEDADMEAYASVHGIPELEFYRMAKSGRRLELFDTLFETLMSAKPNLVFIEEKLLFYKNSRSGPWPESVQKTKQFLLEGILEVIRQRRMPVTSSKDRYYIRDSDLRAQPLLLKKRTDYQAAASIVRARRNFVPSPALHRFLVHARGQNIPVVLLGLPFAQEVEALYPEMDTQYEQKIRQLYLDIYGIEQLPFTDELSEDHFRDLFHVNFDGRDRLSAWFVEQLKGWAP